MTEMLSPTQRHGTALVAPVLAMLALVLVSAVFPPTVSPAAAQSGVWLARGPEGGPVSSLALHPTDAQTVLAGTVGSGVFRSVDGGTTWQELAGSPFTGEVHALAFDPDRPTRIYAALGDEGGGGGVYRSDDGGLGWTRLLPTASLFALALDPVDPDRVWAAGEDGIFFSPDRGRTWEQRFGDAPGEPPVLSLALDPDDPTRLYAGTLGEVLVSDDGGVTWTARELDPADTSPGPVQALAVSPSSPLTVYAGSIGDAFRSDDGGSTWTDLGTGNFAVVDLVVDPENPDVAYLAGGLFLIDPTPQEGVFRTVDGGQTWELLADGLSGEPLSLLLDPGHTDRLLAGTTEGPFRRLAGDAEVSAWTLEDTGLRARPIQDLEVSPAVPDRVLLVDTLGNAFRSRTGGDTWERVSETVASLTAHPADASRVYGSSILAEPFLVSRDGGETLETGLFPRTAPGSRETVTFRAVAVDPRDADTLFVSDSYVRAFPFQVTQIEEVRRSRTGGLTWQEVWGRPTLPAHDLAVDPFDPGVLYAATAQGLRVSRTAGDSWEPLVTYGAVISLEHVAADPVRPGRVWLAGGSALLRSDNGGQTAVSVRGGLPEGRILDLTVDPEAEVVYALVENRGVFRSSNGGTTWRSLTGSLTPRRVTGPLGVSATDPRTVWVGSATGARALTGPPACTPGPTALCLLGGRFKAEVAWEDFQGGTGPGRARTVTDDTGTFWFFTPNNLELMVKVIDGRAVNGHFWVFYGSLSNVAFELTVTDTATGQVRTFANPRNRFASEGDTTAFEGTEDPALVLQPLDGALLEDGEKLVDPLDSPRDSGDTAGLQSTAGGLFVTCGAATNLCLQNQRFRVEVIWHDFEGGTGQGRAVPLTPDTGAFWFFDPDNLELMVKVIDGRAVNGHFWVFLGALTNVELRVVVTDTANGRSWVRENPSGTFASIGDARAFSAEPESPASP